MGLVSIIRPLAGLLAGAIIGVVFGFLQRAASRRHEKLQREGRLKSGMGLLPGSARRVAALMLALAMVQIVCPVLFVDSTQWWVSAGVVGGYGWTLFSQLRQSRA